MTKVRGVTGGGILGNKVSNVTAPKREPVPNRVSPGAVSRQGAVVGEGTPYKSLYDGRGYSTPQGPTPNTENLGPGGCGRQVMRSGSQGTHGSSTSGVARPGADRSIFPGFK
jgi:hypothetical protein